MPCPPISGLIPLVAAASLGWAAGLSLPAAAEGRSPVVQSAAELACTLRPQKPTCPERSTRFTPRSADEARRFHLPAIQFDYGSDRLTAGAIEQVRELAELLAFKEFRSMHLAVLGHTDSVGSAASNRALSLDRARAVKRRLVAERVNPGRLVEVGLGEDYPLPDIAGEDGKNRRVEFVRLGGLEPSPSSPSSRTGTRRALLIGIEEYSQVSPLVGSADDVRAMRSFLVDHLGFDDGEIRELLDSEATRSAILASIEEWLIDGTREGDEAFLFFSGHGYQQPDVNGDERDGLDETLVPFDAVIEAGEEGSVELKGMVADDEMGALLSRLPGRRVSVVIDACHSGTSTKFVPRKDDDRWRFKKTPHRWSESSGMWVRLPDPEPLINDGAFSRGGESGGVGRSSPESFLLPATTGSRSGHDADRVEERVDLTVWAAVGDAQWALVDEEAPGGDARSVFTRRLLWGARDGMADEDRDGIVTRSELYGFVARESTVYCEDHPDVCPRLLEPQLHPAPDAPAGRKHEAAFAPAPVERAFGDEVSVSEILANQAKYWTRLGRGDGVRVHIQPDSRLVSGSSAEIAVESELSGRLVLFTIDPEGRMVQIFPSEPGGASGRIGAGQALEIPGTMTPPLGRWTIVAIVSESGGDRLSSLAARYLGLTAIPRPRAHLVEVGETLRAAGGWSATTTEFVVVER